MVVLVKTFLRVWISFAFKAFFLFFIEIFEGYLCVGLDLRFCYNYDTVVAETTAHKKTLFDESSFNLSAISAELVIYLGITAVLARF